MRIYVEWVRSVRLGRVQSLHNGYAGAGPDPVRTSLNHSARVFERADASGGLDTAASAGHAAQEGYIGRGRAARRRKAGAGLEEVRPGLACQLGCAQLFSEV